MNHTTTQPRLLSKLQITETVVIFIATLMLPFLVHLLPSIGSKPIGAYFLPIFYAPFIGAFLFRRHVALIPALLAPILNHAITGRPAPEVVFIMTCELVIFSLIVSAFKEKAGNFWLLAPLSYIGAKMFSFVLISVVPDLVPAAPIHFVVRSITTAAPGLAALALLNFAALRFKNSR